MKTPRISVVIPVYNGGKYLAQALDSLLCQSFKDFEVLCINDCSTDNSESVLKQYAQKDSRIRVLTTDTNQGIVPKVLKNYALPNLRGEYYAYSSQDDFYSEDWLEKMWRKAKETDADAVLPDLVFYHEHDPLKNRSLIGVYGNRDVMLTNREAVILSLDWIIPGNALWKVSLIKKLGYADFGMFADEYSARVFFYHCNKVVFSGGTFYYGQDNLGAITKQPGYKRFDSPYNHFRLFQFLKENSFDPEIYTRQLMKAVRDLLQKKQELILNKTHYSSDHLKEAESRIQKCYEAITKCDASVKTLKQQTHSKYAHKVFVLTHGYQFFGAYYNFIALMRRFRRLVSLRFGRK